MDDKLFKEHLKALLKDANIAELSQKTGISKVTLYSIRRGNSIPTQGTYKNICNALGITGVENDEIEMAIKPLQSKLSDGVYIVFSRDSIYKLSGTLNQLC